MKFVAALTLLCSAAAFAPASSQAIAGVLGRTGSVWQLDGGTTACDWKIFAPTDYRYLSLRRLRAVPGTGAPVISSELAGSEDRQRHPQSVDSPMVHLGACWL
jgi:hypothetical protein